MLGSKLKNKYLLSADPDGDEVVVTLCEKGLFGEKTLPVDRWPQALPELAAPLARLRADVDAERTDADGRPLVQFDEEAVRLSPDSVARMDAVMASVLNLPPSTPLALNLKSHGLFHEDGFHIETDWVRPGGGGVRTEVKGALITLGGQTRRLPDPVFTLYHLARRMAAPLPESERFALVAQLQDLLPEAAAAGLKANGFLTETRIHYASAFSLKLSRADAFDFDPVLFSRSAPEMAEDGLMPDEDEDALLTEVQQKIFTEKRFRSGGDIKAAYPLRHGQYVFIDPALRPVLREVRKLQSAPLAERKAFVTHPQRVLRDRLGTEAAEAVDLERLFVETEQFSSRVAGVASWSKPVLPWIKPVPNHWLPEKFGLRVGDEPPVEIAPEDIRPLTEAVEAAIAAEQPTVTYGETSLPASAQTRQALYDLAPFAAEPEGCDETGVPFDGPPPILRDKKFLVVKENFVDLEYIGFDRSNAPKDIGPLIMPPHVRSKPKAHQISGIDWLRRSYLSGRNGALLADDMGLGKTFQAIVFMAWLREHVKAQGKTHKPCLIVAPTGLLANWKREIDLHLDAPWLGEVVLAFGANLKLLREEDSFREKDIEAGRASLQASSWQKAGVVLTTYETLRDYQFSFAKSPFELVIFDEVQKLKNPTSQLTVAAKTLNAAFTLGMTGTPVENRLQDLWSITDVLMPGFLGLSRDFDKRYPSNDVEALKRLNGRLCGDEGGAVPYMLRRMKSDHMPDMPEKTARAHRTPMPPAQAEAYAHLVQRAMAGRAGLSQRDGILQILHGMRSVSLHPEPPQDVTDDYIRQSARLLWTVEILEAIRAKEEKALIFLESLEMQAVLAQWLKTRFGLKALPARIHGGVPGLKRQAMVERFQTAGPGFDVMILSPRAGGVGLTLTAANHVIHLSRWWNPAVEDQSTDRVFRIGQTKPVHVYYPLAVHPELGDNSFDVKLNDLLERKRALSRDLLLPPEGDDADISQFFDSVSQMQTAPPPPQQTAASRPVLSLKQALTPAAIVQWKFPMGQAADLSPILDLLRKSKIRSIEISDPYALADSRARDAQIAFLLTVKEACRQTFSTIIEYHPRKCEPAENDDEARRFFFTAWSNHLADLPAPTLRCRKRTLVRDFHDRFVYAMTESAGGATRVHEFNLSRGLIGVMSAEYDSTVTYIPPDLCVA